MYYAKLKDTKKYTNLVEFEYFLRTCIHFRFQYEIERPSSDAVFVVFSDPLLNAWVTIGCLPPTQESFVSYSHTILFKTTT